MIGKLLFFLTLITLLLYSCVPKQQSESNDTLLAKVRGKQLYLSQISEGLPKGIGYEDSVALVLTFVKHWVEDELVISSAEKNKNINIDLIDKQVAEYKKSLLVFAYENEVVKSRLDTIIGDEELSKYYVDNEKNFVLKNHLVKILFIALPEGHKQVSEIRKNYRLNEEGNLSELRKLDQNHLVSCLDTTQWQEFNNIMEIIPLHNKIYDETRFLKSNSKIEFVTGGIRYFVNILDHRLVGQISPFSKEIDKIQGILLNKRIQYIRKNIRKVLFEDAVSANNAKIYND